MPPFSSSAYFACSAVKKFKTSFRLWSSVATLWFSGPPSFVSVRVHSWLASSPSAYLVYSAVKTSFPLCSSVQTIPVIGGFMSSVPWCLRGLVPFVFFAIFAVTLSVTARVFFYSDETSQAPAADLVRDLWMNPDQARAIQTYPDPSGAIWSFENSFDQTQSSPIKAYQGRSFSRAPDRATL